MTFRHTDGGAKRPDPDDCAIVALATFGARPCEPTRADYNRARRRLLTAAGKRRANARGFSLSAIRRVAAEYGAPLVWCDHACFADFDDCLTYAQAGEVYEIRIRELFGALKSLRVADAVVATSDHCLAVIDGAIRERGRRDPRMTRKVLAIFGPEAAS